jgi:hypothetical protein
VVLLLAVGALPLPSIAAQSKRCIPSCKKQRRDCVRTFKQQLRVLKRDCNGTACKSAQRQAFKTRRQQCKKLFREICKPCCREGDGECIAISLHSAEVPPGGSVTSDTAGDGPTEADPVELTVTCPNAGRVAIAKAFRTAQLPKEFEALGVEFIVSAHDSTQEEPLVLTFYVDATRIPKNDAALEIFRDGLLVTPCWRDTTSAFPDPCVASGDRLLSGDARIRVRTSNASTRISEDERISASTWTVAERICGNGTLDADEECDPPGTIGDECPACQLCRPGCVCGEVPPDSCEPNPAGGPDLAGFTVVEGYIDVGWTGTGHNKEIAVGSQVFFACLRDCDASTDPDCTGLGPTGPGSLNGVTAGAPFPVLAENIPVCIENRFAEDIEVRSLNLETGAVDMRVRLETSAFLTGNRDSPCPTCSGSSVGATGTCRTGRNHGESCTTHAVDPQFGNTSSDCPPVGVDFTGAIDVVLDPITSGTATLDATKLCTGGSCHCSGQTKVNDCDLPASCDASNCPGPDAPGERRLGADQACCTSGGEITGCFFDTIERKGEPVPVSPPWPDLTYPKFSTSADVAAAFCIPATQNNSIDVPVGLPGPGAFVFTGDACVDFSGRGARLRRP